MMMLSRSDSTYSASSAERSRLPPLTRMLMSGEVSGEAPRDLTFWEKYDRWMVNEGSRRFTVFIFGLVHAMVFAFGFINYQIKDNLTGARATFGLTYPTARAAALVLHFDIALILFRQSLPSFAPMDANSSSRVPHTHLSSKADTIEWYHTIW